MIMNHCISMLYVIMSRKCFTVFSVFIVLGKRNEYRKIWVLPGFWEMLLNQNAGWSFLYFRKYWAVKAL